MLASQEISLYGATGQWCLWVIATASITPGSFLGIWSRPGRIFFGAGMNRISNNIVYDLELNMISFDCIFVVLVYRALRPERSLRPLPHSPFSRVIHAWCSNKVMLL